MAAVLSPARLRELEPQLRYGGIHRQQDRDARAHGERRWWYMLRVKLPRGRLTPEQYLALDALAERYSHDASLRLTAGQNAQLHGVAAADLPAVVAALREAGLGLGCDPSGLEYNIAAPVFPRAGPRHRVVAELADALCRRLYPAADFDVPAAIAATLARGAASPNLPAHAPRKLTIGLALPEDNSGDVYSQDLGFILHQDRPGDWHAQVLVGGGLSMTRGRADTAARLATPLGTVRLAAVPALVSAAAAIQREYLDLNDRLHARLKYLLMARGADWLRETLAERAGVSIDPAGREFDLTSPPLLGPQPQGDGRFGIVLPLPAGRMDLPLRRALRELIGLAPTLVALPEQRLLLADLTPQALASLRAGLAERGITLGLQPTPVSAMSCVGPPTCRLAVTESERELAWLSEQISEYLVELGRPASGVSLRLAGCPIGCIRPYAAEIGVVGVRNGRYDLYLGGDPGGRRLGELYANAARLEDLLALLRPILACWAWEAGPEERFGDFYARCCRKTPPADVIAGAPVG